MDVTVIILDIAQGFQIPNEWLQKTWWMRHYLGADGCLRPHRQGEREVLPMEHVFGAAQCGDEWGDEQLSTS